MSVMINRKKVLAMVLVLCGGLRWSVYDQSEILTEALEKARFMPEGYVVAGHIRLKSNWGSYALAKMLQQTLNEGENVYMFEGEKLKVFFSGSRERSISLELVTTNARTAEHCRRFWQYFADTWGKGEIIGITVMAKAYEELSPLAQEECCAELAGNLAADGEVNESESMAEGVYYSPKLAKALNVAGQKVNFNVAICPRAGYTDIYLAYPVIYQTY